jgi:hypothetical protein
VRRHWFPQLDSTLGVLYRKVMETGEPMLGVEANSPRPPELTSSSRKLPIGREQSSSRSGRKRKNGCLSTLFEYRKMNAAELRANSTTKLGS